MASDREFLFTSESVNEGHPDKLCDLISDSILDACMAQDPHSYVACESSAKGDLVSVFGEITSKAEVNYEKIVRDAIKEVGYNHPSKGLDFKSCRVYVGIEEQSPDISQSVHEAKSDDEIGAGDQGIMFGYATDETPEFMPLSHMLATGLGARLTYVRKKGVLPWVAPDGKTQVTVEYRRVNGALVPQRVHTILISTQHTEDVSMEQIQKDLKEHVINEVVPGKFIDDKTIYHLNPSGRFVIGGPHGDAGLTGRKIIVDTYGGWGSHGGGAFSGKDPSKVDRSAAYAARWIAKSLVACGLAKRCLVQLSYAIGLCEPLSIFVETYGTGSKPDMEIEEIVKQNFDLRPGAIIKDLKLRRPIFKQTACYGHFGRDGEDFSWEKPKQLRYD